MGIFRYEILILSLTGCWKPQDSSKLLVSIYYLMGMVMTLIYSFHITAQINYLIRCKSWSEVGPNANIFLEILLITVKFITIHQKRRQLLQIVTNLEMLNHSKDHTEENIIRYHRNLMR